MSETTEKSVLPNLYVRGHVADRQGGQYVLAWFERQHDTEHLYIPAARIRELLCQYRDNKLPYHWLAEQLEALIVRDEGRGRDQEAYGCCVVR